MICNEKKPPKPLLKAILVIFVIDIIWQGQKDLNPRHVVLETTALPTELYPYNSNYYIINAAGVIVNIFVKIYT